MKTKFTLLLACVFYAAASFSQAYCSFTSAPYSANQPGITNFKMANVNRSSANVEGNNALVSTGVTLTLTIGQTYSFSVTSTDDLVSGPPLTGAPQSVRIYVDFNQNFTFTDPGETAFSFDYITPGTTYTNAIGVTVPATVTPGNSKLRVTAKMGPAAGHTAPTPCNVPADPLGYHGEMEEYNVVFVSGATNANAIFAVNANACTNAAITVTNNSTGSPTPTYTWSTSPAAIISNSAAANPSITFSTNGTYTVSLVATNAGTTSTATHTVVAAVCSGIPVNNLMSENISLYPNPAKDKINIEVTLLTSYNYQMTDLLGKIIISGNVNNKESAAVDISNINKGIYFLTIECKDQKATKKIIIE
jgi:hypothetical protein